MFNLTDEERTKLRDLMSMEEERHRLWLEERTKLRDLMSMEEERHRLWLRDHAEARETRRENIKVSWILTWLQFAEVVLLFVLLATWIIKL